MYFSAFDPPLDPDDAALRLAAFGPLAWLDGGTTHGREGRWSFVSVGAREHLRVPHGTPDPFAALSQLDRDARGALPLRGPLAPEEIPRWIGYLAYDAAWSGVAGARHARAEGALAVHLVRPEALYAHDHDTGEAWLVGETWEALETLRARLGTPPPPAPQFAAHSLEVPPPSEHRRAVVRALAHMHAGDIYQVNLARRFRCMLEGSPLALWRRMRTLSPVPLGAYLDAGDHQVLACTMERFLRFTSSDGALYTSPIKGTVARQGDDAGEARALRADTKERAEHSMVVDLMRNDLGRVALPGTVQVDPLMRVDPFAGLHHLSSTVHAQAHDDLELDELLRATFPPGSVTGTPKARALEIIEALEPCPRGVYCGAVGFVDQAGGCSFAVAIRTATVVRGEVSYFAGGGLVVESDPVRETEETDLKARVFLDAIEGTASDEEQ